jgi:hypothetical protein
MPLRGLAAAIVVSALVLAAPASAHTYEFDTVPDAAGDGDPDITRVVTGSNSTGAITFVVGLGNRTQLRAAELVQILIDSDNSAATGQPPNGAEHMLQMDAQEVRLLRWNGSAFERVAAPTIYGYIYRGFRLAVNKSDLGGVPAGSFRYWVHTSSGATSDDSAMSPHALSAQVLRLRIAEFAFYKSVKVGKPYLAAMRVHRSDLGENTSAGLIRCVAKLGKKTLKVQALFPEDVAGCVGTAPKAAKKRTIKVTLSLTLDRVKVTRTVTVKVT